MGGEEKLATDSANQNMQTIEVISPCGEHWYGRIASQYFTKGYSPPLIITEIAYMPVRALAAYVDSDIEWDGAAHDSFYVGKLTWNPDELSIVIDGNAQSPYNYQDRVYRRFRRDYASPNSGRR